MNFKKVCIAAIAAMSIVGGSSGVAPTQEISGRYLIRDIITSMPSERLIYDINCVERGRPTYRAHVILGTDKYIFAAEKTQEPQTKLRVVLNIDDGIYVNLRSLVNEWDCCSRYLANYGLLEPSDTDIPYAETLMIRFFRENMVHSNADLFQCGKLYLNFENTSTFLINIWKLNMVDGYFVQFIGGFLISEHVEADNIEHFLQQTRFDMARDYRFLQRTRFAAARDHHFLERNPALDNIPVAFIRRERFKEVDGKLVPSMYTYSSTYGGICDLLGII